MKSTLETELETAAHTWGKLEREMDTLLAAHEAADHKAFEDRYVEARGHERDLARKAKEFQQQIPVARDLDERIAPLDGLRLALDVLCSYTEGKFVGFAVERRHRSLLGGLRTSLPG